MDRLIQNFRKLLNAPSSGFYRYMYARINWGARMIGLTGPRGVGKTTMILQHIKDNMNLNETLYVTAEDFYFSENKLVDLADTFTKKGGKYLFVDEIHKYKEWSRELKLIYDYHPELNIVFIGSSVLDINKGASDLSRRAVMYHMQGLSFREYLELFHNVVVPRFTLTEVLTHKAILPSTFKPLVYFEQYQKSGYYPFAKDTDFDTRLMQIINQTIESDIPMYAEINISTARKLTKLLSIISRSVPFKPNISTIATALSASRNSIADYLLFMEEAGLISQLRDSTGGIRGLAKVDKIYLDNTNLIYSLANISAEEGNVRETFFMNQLRVDHSIINSKVSDFMIDDMTFELGGRKKGNKQIEDIAKGYIVKDNIETSYLNVIPLWLFGMLY